MAVCKRCGKKGLFLTLNSNGLCKDCAEAEKKKASKPKSEEEIKAMLREINPEFAKQEAYLARQDEMLKELNQAIATIDAKENPNELIAAYEKVLVNTDEPLRSNARVTELIDLYVKNGYRDKAWGFLNSLFNTGRYDLNKIRNKQAQILKLEKRDRDAIEKYMLKHLADSAFVTNHDYTEKSFLSDIKVSAKRLKWNEEITDALFKILQDQIKQKDLNEVTLINKYRAYLKEHDLI